MAIVIAPLQFVCYSSPNISKQFLYKILLQLNQVSGILTSKLVQMFCELISQGIFY